ncbi:uncharacterized protein LOC100127280 precursor [Xenopus laevis]|uniref:LOC100127280 protein n=1 Tax=Xenopus laevis TaxID=8355 RepID=A9JTJ2_XENLA|nr:uncharacterized protein LOC100127280 precursor [Xenopus laevis]AAI55365.1 LOC100127280 protein [Xenopus laevis]
MKGTLIVLVALAGAWAAPQGREPGSKWINDYDKPFSFQCPDQQSIGFIISKHNNRREDRVWNFTCQYTLYQPHFCNWTDYINDFDQELNFTCPLGSVVSGIQSYHDNKKEDRRWKFLCCQGEVAVAQNCTWGDYVNDFDECLTWKSPPNHHLVGAFSYHDNGKEDRRWKYYSCERSDTKKTIGGLYSCAD